jgi:hypothetical protein
MPSLNKSVKCFLLKASSQALKGALCYPHRLKSANNLRGITKTATPAKICNDKLGLQQYKTFNECFPKVERMCLNYNQTNLSHQTKFNKIRNNILHVSMNALTNRFHFLNGKIPVQLSNNSFNKYKIDCKKNCSYHSNDTLQLTINMNY